MRAFIFVTCLAVAALAHPEAGYSYNGLQQSQRGLPANAHILKPHVHQQLPAEQSFNNFAAQQMMYGAPSAAPPNSPEQIGTPVAPEEPSLQVPQSHHQDSYNMAYAQSSIPQEGGYAYAPTETKVHKHIYVHVPPKDFEDEDAIQPRVVHQAGPNQKHYKIVFIKAPSAPQIRAPIVPPPPQNEEKTLIYVLHKKPEMNPDIVIPTAAPTKPSKPEVYFIKYKTRKEEAPVYGPPPQQQSLDLDARHGGEPSAEYGTPAAEDFMPMDNIGDLSAPITTIQPAIEEQSQQQQFINEPQQVPAETYGAPTMAAFTANEEIQSTVAAAPSNQYLAPQPTPIIVAEEEAHLPATNYGPPNRFFIKKRK